ncbi:DUF512 domain-containing protein [Acetanaerobacterium elongatum]|uniref:Putative radical SAM enzyme, TIGR03279 family n=1 Tax=Acetanaerobacterium elongatum TaxID=258515 RepID=A0A1G9WY78_9FIRM|nr:DUF512 domain-containing protein [Acetanaerobacterium elongatum]SDM89399.1 putative radical SAM enzyme, TIGR03279 family [Acetanaerobacterium elongatum]
MPVVIAEVKEHSPAFRAGLSIGDTLLRINENEINDVLDYRFYMTNRILSVEYLRAGCLLATVIKKGEYEELGLEFDTFLMDKQHSCQNRCIFCFVDQLPKGMRETLYFKDDDSRMSFLFGNYITLTNLTDSDVERIVKMKISPVNISVHTTNPLLRVEMMKNKRAGESLRFIKRLAQGGIKINAQLVLCPGINDGEELVRSLNDLSEYYPWVESIALVPVGLTKYRQNLPELVPYTVDTARAVITIAQEFSDNFLKLHGTRLAYPADEFFIKAQLPIPDADYYEEFAQLDNGVGLIASLREDFRLELEDLAPSEQTRKVTIATGMDACSFLVELVDELKEKWHNLTCNVIPIRNDFFGHTITVAGLVTGGDLLEQLKGYNLGEELLLPEVMLRYEQDRFLDDITVKQAEQALSIPIHVVKGGGAGLLRAICGLE